MSDDWRAELLEIIAYLRGQSFIRKPYKGHRPGWDHNHCAVCGLKFAESDIQGETVLHEGYAITADHDKGADYEWVCPGCFEASKNEMNWKDVTPAS